MNAHVPTMFLMIVVIGATLSVAVGSVANRKARDGLMLWAAGLVAHTLTYALFAQRGRISDILSIVVANTLLACTLALFTEGLYQFQQREAPHRLIWTPAVIVVIVFAILIEDQPMRIIVGGVIFAAQCALALFVLWERRRETTGRGKYFLAAGLALVAAVFASRSIATANGSIGMASLTESSQIQTITFLVSMICLILVSLGFVLMSKERADELNRILAMKDELTGLSNRRHILDALNQHLALAKRSGQPLTLLMIDLDHFKRVNDTFGHLVGDKTLRRVSTIICSRLRTQDIAGRFGGEEFLLLLPNTAVEGGQQLAEELRKTVSESVIDTVDDQQVRITLSIGVSSCRVSRDRRAEDMIGAADQALYRAKEAGRNRVEMA